MTRNGWRKEINYVDCFRVVYQKGKATTNDVFKELEEHERSEDKKQGKSAHSLTAQGLTIYDRLYERLNKIRKGKLLDGDGAGRKGTTFWVKYQEIIQFMLEGLKWDINDPPLSNFIEVRKLVFTGDTALIIKSLKRYLDRMFADTSYREERWSLEDIFRHFILALGEAGVKYSGKAIGCGEYGDKSITFENLEWLDMPLEHKDIASEAGQTFIYFLICCGMIYFDNNRDSKAVRTFKMVSRTFCPVCRDFIKGKHPWYVCKAKIKSGVAKSPG